MYYVAPTYFARFLQPVQHDYGMFQAVAKEMFEANDRDDW